MQKVILKLMMKKMEKFAVDEVTVTGKVDTKKVGTYSIKYSVNDSGR